MIRLKPRDPGPLWKLFSSVWLAVGLMISVAVMSLVGHVLGIKETEEVFFGSWWFGGILVLLGLNIFVCTLQRSPWRLSQMPFLIVHTGLLLMITWGVESRFLKQEGSLAVQRGDKSNLVLQESRELLVEVPATKQGDREIEEWDIRLTHLPQTDDLQARPNRIARLGALFYLAFAVVGGLAALKISGKNAAVLVMLIVAIMGFFSWWVTRRPWRYGVNNGAATLSVLKYYPHHDVRLKQEPDADGPPGIDLLLRHPAPMGTTQVDKFPMFAGNDSTFMRQGRYTFGFFHVSSEKERQELLASGAKSQGLGTVVISSKKSNTVVRVPAPCAPSKTFEVDGYSVRFERFIRNATKMHQQNRQDEPDDEPALDPWFVAIVEPLQSGPGTEKPQKVVRSARQKGADPHMGDHPVVQFDWDVPPASPLADHSVSIVHGPESGRFELVTKNPDHPDLPPQLLKQGDFSTLSAVMPMLALSFENFHAHARAGVDLVPVDPETLGNEEKPIDALYVRLEDKQGRAQEGWISTHPEAPEFLHVFTAQLGPDLYRVGYRHKQWKLPFEIALDKFTIEKHEGTDRPAGFQSDVTVLAPKSDVPEYKYQIYMNHTLSHDGVKLFQSSYIQRPGEEDISIFAVCKDPGGILFYVGFVILCFGIVSIFWVKPFLREIEKKRARARASESSKEAVS